MERRAAASGARRFQLFSSAGSLAAAAVLAAFLGGCATSTAAAGGSAGQAEEVRAGGDQSASSPSDAEAPLSAAQRMDEFCKVLDDNGLNYIRDNEKGRILVDFGLENSLKRVRCAIRCDERGFIVNATVEQTAEDIGARYGVMEFITRLNFLLRVGDFELDLSDGQLIYKTYGLYDGAQPMAAQVLMESVRLPVAMFQKHGEAISRLMEGKADAKEEFEKTVEDMK